MNYKDELIHSGRLGMKWGRRRSPSELGYTNNHHGKNPSTSSTASKNKIDKKITTLKKTGYSNKEIASRIGLKEGTVKKVALSNKREISKKDNESTIGYERSKENALRSGKATEVAKYRHELSNKELSDAVSRIDTERRLSSLKDSETSTRMKRVDDIMNNVGKVTDWGRKGVAAYNLVADINNTFSTKSQMKKIGSKNNSSKKQDDE